MAQFDFRIFELKIVEKYRNNCLGLIYSCSNDNRKFRINNSKLNFPVHVKWRATRWTYSLMKVLNALILNDLISSSVNSDFKVRWMEMSEEVIQNVDEQTHSRFQFVFLFNLSIIICILSIDSILHHRLFTFFSIFVRPLPSSDSHFGVWDILLLAACLFLSVEILKNVNRRCVKSESMAIRWFNVKWMRDLIRYLFLFLLLLWSSLPPFVVGSFFTRSLFLFSFFSVSHPRSIWPLSNLWSVNNRKCIKNTLICIILKCAKATAKFFLVFYFFLCKLNKNTKIECSAQNVEYHSFIRFRAHSVDRKLR